MSIANLTSALSRKLLQNSPAILTGIGVAGVVGTALLAGKAAVQAHEEIRHEQRLRDIDNDAEVSSELTPKEKVQLTWKYFLPPFIVGSATIACVISAQSINSRRSAALMSLYTLGDRALTEFREKTAEIHGQNQIEKIEEEIAKDRVSELVPVHQDSFERVEGMGLCYDVWTDREFVSSRNIIDAAVNEVNAEINRNMYASLNFFYDRVGLGRIAMGDDFGWNSDRPLEVSYVYHPAKDGTPCMAVNFKRSPQQDYYSFR